MKKFFKHDSVEVLQYLGRAYFKAGKLKEAKTVFLKVSYLNYKLISNYSYYKLLILLI
jgi:hypothetical protein